MFIKFILLVFFVIEISAEVVNTNRSNLWMESSEYNLLCQQVFSSARNNIERLDLNNSHSAILEKYSKQRLPLAIITDIDETILLNYKFQIETRKRGGAFSYKLFEEYVNKKTAIAINGSVDYYQYLATKGIKIIYISNRHISSKNKTFEHLRELGFPIESMNDLLLKNERKEWSSDKSSRREYIANKYTIIQLFGDSLKDFVSTEEQALQNKKMFGKRWFMLPNPVYGNWLK